MIQNLPDLIEAGVDSLKIEGRMKSIHYVSTVSNVYRAAVDSYCEDPDNYVCKQEWIDELWKAAQRELATGFLSNSNRRRAIIWPTPSNSSICFRWTST